MHSPQGRETVVITGMSVISTLGDTLEAFHQALLQGQSGITRWRNALYDGGASRIGGDLSTYDLDAKQASLRERIPPEAFRRLRRLAASSPRAARVAMLTAAAAFTDAGLFGTQHPERMAAILAGHYLYDVYKLTNWQAFAVDPDESDVSLGVKEIDTDALACIMNVLGLTGPAYSLGGACAAGNIALRAAVDEIRHHACSAVVVVSAFQELAPASLHSLARLGALSLGTFDAEPSRASRPFDAGRNGFVPATGAAGLVLESLEHARARGVRIYAEVLGVGVNSSGSRNPSPMEEHMAGAMTLALAEAGLEGTAIDAICAHATATPLGDLAEAKAIRRVFGEHAGALKVNALKSMLGHQLSASALVETVASVLELRAGVLYPTINIERVDPEIGLDVCPNQSIEYQATYLMKNAFGFGGVNTACILGRYA